MTHPPKLDAGELARKIALARNHLRQSETCAKQDRERLFALATALAYDLAGETDPDATTTRRTFTHWLVDLTAGEGRSAFYRTAVGVILDELAELLAQGGPDLDGGRS